MQRQDGDHDFAAVLAAARGGEAWALTRIYASLGPEVAALFRVRGAAEPEDLTSEVFVGVLRGIGAFDGDEPAFRSWIFTIAYRRPADEGRRCARRPRLVPLDLRPEAPATDDVAGEVERSLATERIRALCEQLVPSQRDVLLLRVVGRLTVEEVARLMGRSPSAVKALQRRGLATVVRLLEPEDVAL
jgi:RNA polymerase sigma-70 factor (ECF subfamily)